MVDDDIASKQNVRYVDYTVLMVNASCSSFYALDWHPTSQVKTGG